MHARTTLKYGKRQMLSYIMKIVQGNNHGHYMSHNGCDNLYLVSTTFLY